MALNGVSNEGGLNFEQFRDETLKDLNLDEQTKLKAETELRKIFDKYNINTQTDGKEEVLDAAEQKSAEFDVTKLINELKFKQGTNDLQDRINSTKGKLSSENSELEEKADKLSKQLDALTKNGQSQPTMGIAAQQAPKAPSTGDYFGFRYDDGTSCTINKNQITWYSADGREIASRAMTEEEKTLSQDELQTKLKESFSQNRTPVKQDNEGDMPADVRKINGNGVSGSYAIVKTEKGYEVKSQLYISPFQNQAHKAYMNGLTDKFGMPNVEPDKDGYYNFRGIKTKLYDVLKLYANSKAIDLATKNAIYNDIQTRIKEGATVTEEEQAFMNDYQNLLVQYGLQINENGELEDIPKQGRKRR